MKRNSDSRKYNSISSIPYTEKSIKITKIESMIKS